MLSHSSKSPVVPLCSRDESTSAIVSTRDVSAPTVERSIFTLSTSSERQACRQDRYAQSTELCSGTVVIRSYLQELAQTQRWKPPPLMPTTPEALRWSKWKESLLRASGAATRAAAPPHVAADALTAVRVGALERAARDGDAGAARLPSSCRSVGCCLRLGCVAETDMRVQ